MTAYLIKLVLAALLGISVLRAAWPRTANEVHRHQLLRRRAEWLTVAVGVVAAFFLISSAFALPRGDRGPNPLGTLAFLAFWVVVAAGFAALRPLWRAARQERARHLRSLGAGPDAGVPDSPPAAHLGLSGQEQPPTRW